MPDYRKEFFEKEARNAMEEHVLDLIIQHEGLEPYQTPFRITRPQMREWSTIHGFPVDRERVPSKGRENFLYLRNQEDLLPAVRQQFINYMKNPKKYGLKKTPTLEDAVKVFDQTGAEGKLKYLFKGGVSAESPLTEYFDGEEN